MESLKLGPTIIAPIVSSKPNIIPPKNAPLMLPYPPKTTTTKALN